MSDDPIFDRFAARLADAVTVAINSGIRISASDKSCFCPLGCLGNPDPNNKGYYYRRPIGALARSLDPCVEELPPMAPLHFGSVFDEGNRFQIAGNEKYQALAMKYRERFP